MKAIRKIMFAMFAISALGMAVSCGNRNSGDDDSGDTKGGKNASVTKGIDGEKEASSGSRKFLTQALAEVKKQLPMSMGAIGEMTRFDIEGDNVVMEARVNESYVNLDVLESHPELVRENMVTMMTNSSNPALGTFLGFIQDANMGMKLIYVGESSGKRISASMTSEEIKNIMASAGDQKDPDALLDKQIELTNIQTPMDMGAGMSLVRLAREGNYLVCYCECDETVVPISAIKESKREIKAGLRMTMSSNASDLSVRELVRMCKDAGVGINYNFKGKHSRESVTVGLSAAELD